MADRVLSLGAGQFQIAGITEAQELGFEVVAMDVNPAAPGMTIADFAAPTDIQDIPKAIEIAKEHQVKGVFCIAVENAVKTVAAVAKELNLTAISMVAADNATNKHFMRRIWSEKEVPSPISIPCTTFAETEIAAASLPWPVVIKPSDGSGSRGVSLVTGKSDLRRAYILAEMYSKNKLILVEEFMPGVELSVEAFVYKGKLVPIALSDKIRTDPPYLLDMTVLFPSDQPGPIQTKAIQIVERAALCLGIDYAAVHAEVMITPDGPKMVELAARGAGFKVFSEMVPWVSGVPVIKELIRMSVGQQPDLKTTSKRGSVLHFPFRKPGRIQSVTGIEMARALPGISDVEIYVKPGDVVRPLTCGADRIGHIISKAETRSEAESLIKEAEDLIHIVVQHS